MNSAQDTMGELKTAVGEATSAIAQAYGGQTETEDAILVSGAAGTVTHPKVVMDAVLAAVNGATNLRTVQPGRLGGEARCVDSTVGGQKGSVCAWVDNYSVGVVTFLSETTHDRSAEFIKIREQLEMSVG